MLGKKSTVQNVRLNRAASFALENLESRCLLSAAIVARPTGDSLVVRGTNRADTITVGLNADTSKIDVSINGVVQQFDKATVTSIVISSGGGSDQIKVNETNGVLPVGVFANGGGSSDYINGSSLGDTLYGGDSSDYINGNGGDDLINGKAGNDYLWGGDGNDTLIGADGRDGIFAGDGDDTSYGGGGADSINSGTGSNYANGGGGANHVDDGYSQGVKAPVVNQVSSPFAVNNTPFGLAPSDVRKAYNFGSLSDSTYTNRGGGQAIAIIAAYDTPTAFNDITRFSTEYGLTTPTSDNFRTVYATGVRPGADPSVFDFNGWSYEASLDIQWAHAIAPDATIILVEAASNLNADLIQATEVASRLLVSEFGGGVVSMSFGDSSESNYVAWDAAFRKKAYKNISYVAASGDEYDTLGGSPASSSRVLAVGGTVLLFDNAGNRAGELGWKDPDSTGGTTGGSGGGASNVIPVPDYQKNLLVGLVPIGDNRVTPDVSYVSGDPVAVFTSFPDSINGDTGWVALRGTSAAAPQWAGLLTLANQRRREVGRSYLGSDTNNDIYALAQSNQGQYFYDITEEQVDQNSTTTPDFKTTVRFDEITGWGSPRADNLIDGLTSVSASKSGTIDFSWSGEYREAASKYPGGLFNAQPAKLFTDYRGTGVAEISSGSVNLTFRVVTAYNGGTLLTFRMTNLKRSLGNIVSGTATGVQIIAGVQTTTNFILSFEGSVGVNGGGGLEIRGSFKGLNFLTGEQPVRGLEEEFFGTVTS